jgi:hypothetical protein
VNVKVRLVSDELTDGLGYDVYFFLFVLLLSSHVPLINLFVL